MRLSERKFRLYESLIMIVLNGIAIAILLRDDN